MSTYVSLHLALNLENPAQCKKPAVYQNSMKQALTERRSASALQVPRSTLERNPYVYYYWLLSLTEHSVPWIRFHI